MNHKGSRLLSLLDSGKANPIGGKVPLISTKPGASRVRSSTQISSPPPAKNSNLLHTLSTDSNVVLGTGGNQRTTAISSQNVSISSTGLTHCQPSSLQITSCVISADDTQTSEDTDPYMLMLASAEETSYTAAHVSQGRARSSLSSLSTSIFSSRTSRAPAAAFTTNNTPSLIDDTSTPVIYPSHVSSPVDESCAPAHQAPVPSSFSHSTAAQSTQPPVRSRVRARRATMTDTSVVDASSCLLTPTSSSPSSSTHFLSSLSSSSITLSSSFSSSSSSSHPSLFSSASSSTPISLFSPSHAPHLASSTSSPSSASSTSNELSSHNTHDTATATAPHPTIPTTTGAVATATASTAASATTVYTGTSLATASASVSATAPAATSTATFAETLPSTSSSTFISKSTSTPTSALTSISSSTSSSRRSCYSPSSLSTSLFTPSESASQLSRAHSHALSRAQSRSQLSHTHSCTLSHTQPAQMRTHSQPHARPLATSASNSVSTSAPASASASTSASTQTRAPPRSSSRLARSHTHAHPSSHPHPSSQPCFSQPTRPSPPLSSSLPASSPAASEHQHHHQQQQQQHQYVHSRAEADPPTLTALLLALLQGRPSQSVAHLLAHTATQLRTHFSPLADCLSDALSHAQQLPSPTATHPTSSAKTNTSTVICPYAGTCTGQGADTGTGADTGAGTRTGVGNGANTAARRREANALLGHQGIAALEAALACTARASSTAHTTHNTHTTRTRRSARQSFPLPPRILALAAALRPILSSTTSLAPTALLHHLPPHIHAALLPPVPVRVCPVSPLLLAAARQVLAGGADPLRRDADGACALWLAVQGGPSLPETHAGVDTLLTDNDAPLGLGQYGPATGRSSAPPAPAPAPPPPSPALSPADILACLLPTHAHTDHALQRRLRRAAPAGPHSLAAALREVDDAGMGASVLVSSLLEHVHGLHSLRAVVGVCAPPATRLAAFGAGAGVDASGDGAGGGGDDSDDSDEEAYSGLYLSQHLSQLASPTLSHSQRLAHNTTPRRHVPPVKVRVEGPDGALYLRVVAGPAAIATAGRARGVLTACAAALSRPTRHSSGRYWQWPLPDVALVCGNATAALMLLEAGALPSEHGYVAGAHAEALRLRCGAMVEDARETGQRGREVEDGAEDICAGLSEGARAADTKGKEEGEVEVKTGTVGKAETEVSARAHVELPARPLALDAQEDALLSQLVATTAAVTSPSTSPYAFDSPRALASIFASVPASVSMSAGKMFSSPQPWASEHGVSQNISNNPAPTAPTPVPGMGGQVGGEMEAQGPATAAVRSGMHSAPVEVDMEVSPATRTAHAEAHLSLDAAAAVFSPTASPVPRLRSRRASTHTANAKAQAPAAANTMSFPLATANATGPSLVTANAAASAPVHVPATPLANVIAYEPAPGALTESRTTLLSPSTLHTHTRTARTTLASLATRGHATSCASAASADTSTGAPTATTATTDAVTGAVTGAVARAVPVEVACDVFAVDTHDDATTIKRSRLRVSTRQPLPTAPLFARHTTLHAARHPVPHAASITAGPTAPYSTALVHAQSPTFLCDTVRAQMQPSLLHDTMSPSVATDAFHTPQLPTEHAPAPSGLLLPAWSALTHADTSPTSVLTTVAPVSVAGVLVRVGAAALVQCVSSAIVGPLPSDNTDNADCANNDPCDDTVRAGRAGVELYQPQGLLSTASSLLTRAHPHTHHTHAPTASLTHASTHTLAASLALADSLAAAMADPMAASIEEECKRDCGAEVSSPYTALLASPTLGEVLVGPRKGPATTYSALEYATSPAPLGMPHHGPSAVAAHAPPLQEPSRAHLPRASGLLCSPRIRVAALDTPTTRPLGLLEAAELLHQQRIAEELNVSRGSRTHKSTHISFATSAISPAKRARAPRQHPLTASYSFADALAASQPPPPWRVRQLLDAGLWAALVAAGRGGSAAAREEMGAQREVVRACGECDEEDEMQLPSVVPCVCGCASDVAGSAAPLLTRLSCSRAWTAVRIRIAAARQAAQKPVSPTVVAADSTQVQRVLGLLAHGADAWAPGCVARGLRRRVMVGADDDSDDHAGAAAAADAVDDDLAIGSDSDAYPSQLYSDSEGVDDDTENARPRKRRCLRDNTPTRARDTGLQWVLEEDEAVISDVACSDTTARHHAKSCTRAISSSPVPVAPAYAAAQSRSSALSQGDLPLALSRSSPAVLPCTFFPEAPLADSLPATLPLDDEGEGDLDMVDDDAVLDVCDDNVVSVGLRGFSPDAPRTQHTQHTPGGCLTPTASHSLPAASTPARRPTSVLARLSARLSSLCAPASARAGSDTNADANVNVGVGAGVGFGVGARGTALVGQATPARARGARSSACVYRGPVEWEGGAWALFYQCAWSLPPHTHAAQAQSARIQPVCAEVVHTQRAHTRAYTTPPVETYAHPRVRGMVPRMPPARDIPIMAAVRLGCSPAVLAALLAFARVTDTSTCGHAWLHAGIHHSTATDDDWASDTGAGVNADAAAVVCLSAGCDDVTAPCSRYCAAEVVHVTRGYAQWLPRSASCVVDEALVTNTRMGDSRAYVSEAAPRSRVQLQPHAPPHPSPRRWLCLLSLRGPQGVSALGLAVLLQAVDLARVLARAGADVMQPLYADYPQGENLPVPQSSLRVGGCEVLPGRATRASELGSVCEPTQSILAHALQQRAWSLVAALVEGALEHSLALRTPPCIAGEATSPQRDSMLISDDCEEDAGSDTRTPGHVLCCPALCLPWLSPKACAQRSRALTHATHALYRAGMLEQRPLTTSLVSADAEEARLALRRDHERDAAWDAAYRAYEHAMVPLPSSQLFVDE